MPPAERCRGYARVGSSNYWKSAVRLSWHFLRELLLSPWLSRNFPRMPMKTLLGKAGASLGSKLGPKGMLALLDGHSKAEFVLQGLALLAYKFSDHKSKKKDGKHRTGSVLAMAANPEDVEKKFLPLHAVSKGVFLTRDLVSEPSNVLTTLEFASRLEQLREVGLEVEVLDESELRKIGMRALLGVGQGSASPHSSGHIALDRSEPPASRLGWQGRCIRYRRNFPEARRREWKK